MFASELTTNDAIVLALCLLFMGFIYWVNNRKG